LALRRSTEIRRITTGIRELDQVLGGGIPEGSVVLVLGAPGIGKTIFLTQFVLAGVKTGEPGLYICFDETRASYERNMRAFGWDLSRYENFHILDAYSMARDPERFNLDDLVALVRDEVRDREIHRVSVDSLSSIPTFVLLRDQPDRARAAMRRFFDSFRAMRVTTLMSCEMEPTTKTGPFGFEVYLADGVIRMDTSLKEDGVEWVRFFDILKLRGAPHETIRVPYRLQPGVGVVGDWERVLAREGAAERFARLDIDKLTRYRLLSLRKRYFERLGQPVPEELERELKALEEEIGPFLEKQRKRWKGRLGR